MEHSSTPPGNNADVEMEDVKDDKAAEPAARRDWRTCLKNIISPNYRNEVVEVSKLAVPVFLSQTMTFLITVASMIFCGHLGKTEFAGVSLAVTVINVTGISIGFGLSLTCDTFISQTYGSDKLKRVGVILQRSILILLLACFPCWAVLINTEPLLLAVKQRPEVASTTPPSGDNAKEEQAQPQEQIPNQDVSTPTTVGEVLPVKRLVVRRGLAFLLMVVILVAGIVL